jgi:hypothetical protein
MRDELFEAGSICSKPNSEYLVGSSEHLDTLLEIAEPVRSLRNAPREVVEATILLLCDGRYLTLENLADLLNRGKDSLRNHTTSTPCWSLAGLKRSTRISATIPARDTGRRRGRRLEERCEDGLFVFEEPGHEGFGDREGDAGDGGHMLLCCSWFNPLLR